jgi:hypothetical protein
MLMGLPQLPVGIPADRYFGPKLFLFSSAPFESKNEDLGMIRANTAAVRSSLRPR